MTSSMLALIAVAASGWNVGLQPLHTARRASVHLALPAGWQPSMGLPAGVSINDGFLGRAADRAEAEAALGVTASSDEGLWDTNDFSDYAAGATWASTGFDRVVLLPTFLKLRASKFTLEMVSDRYYEEYIENFFGRRLSNRWVVYGYVSPSSRIVRSTEGSCYGAWTLVTLEPDAGPTRLSWAQQTERADNYVMSFEKR
jgi:hypothetical protein